MRLKKRRRYILWDLTHQNLSSPKPSIKKRTMSIFHNWLGLGISLLRGVLRWASTAMILIPRGRNCSGTETPKPEALCILVFNVPTATECLQSQQPRDTSPFVWTSLPSRSAWMRNSVTTRTPSTETTPHRDRSRHSSLKPCTTRVSGAKLRRSPLLTAQTSSAPPSTSKLNLHHPKAPWTRALPVPK